MYICIYTFEWIIWSLFLCSNISFFLFATRKPCVTFARSCCCCKKKCVFICYSNVCVLLNVCRQIEKEHIPRFTYAFGCERVRACMMLHLWEPFSAQQNIFRVFACTEFNSHILCIVKMNYIIVQYQICLLYVLVLSCSCI